MLVSAFSSRGARVRLRAAAFAPEEAGARLFKTCQSLLGERRSVAFNEASATARLSRQVTLVRIGG